MMSMTRKRVVVSALALAAGGGAAAVGVTTASAGSDATASRSPVVRVQGQVVPDPLKRIAAAEGATVDVGGAANTAAGTVTESRLIRDERVVAICMTVALRGGGGSASCANADFTGSLSRPLASATALGHGRYALTAMLPRGASAVRVGSSPDTERSVPVSESGVAGTEGTASELARLSYTGPSGKAEFFDSSSLVGEVAK